MRTECMMKTFKQEPMLHGWDDEKVYYYDEKGVEHCVNDEPELLAQLMEICRAYFVRQVKNAKGKQNRKSSIENRQS